MALQAGDLAVLNETFWESPHTLRFGPTGNQYGHPAIAEARIREGAVPRAVTRKIVTTYGRDYAMTHVEFVSASVPRGARQSQTWLRLPEGWRVVAAHISPLPGD